MTSLLIVGIAAFVLGALILVLFPDRPGGKIAWQGVEVSSKGAGLPLIVVGIVAIAISEGRSIGEGDDGAEETSSDCEFAITNPQDLEEMRQNGVLVKGTACEGELVWLLDYDFYDESYYQVNTEPLDIAGGRWGFLDTPIGDVGDPLGTVYRIVAVSASKACSEALESKKADEDGTVRFRALPGVCPDGSKPSRQVKHVRVVKA